MKTRYGAIKSAQWISCALGAAALLAMGCGDDGSGDGDGDGDSVVFDVQLENVSPAFSIAKMGAIDAPIMPGANIQITFTAPRGSNFSFVSMFVQSNDLFYAPDENGIPLWDSEGNRIVGDASSQIMIWDAGTEINQPLGLGPDQVLNQAAPNTGAPDPDNTVRLATDANLPAINQLISVMIAAGTTDNEFVVTISNLSDANTLDLGNGNSAAVPMSPGIWAVHSAPGIFFTPGQSQPGEGLEGVAEDGDQEALNVASMAKTGVNIPISPGVFAVHRDPNVLFTVGQADLGNGLESVAEDGNTDPLAANLMTAQGVTSSGAFNTPVGASGPGGLAPGASPAAAYKFQVRASPGDRLSFAAMFVASNDLFLAPGAEGIALFTGMTPVSGDVSSEITVWDAGTEVNQEPGVGLDQVQHQSAPNTGATEGGVVQTITAAADGYMYPAASDVIRVIITPVP